MTLPLPALLSAAFVAFTIEADNEGEQLVAHTTTAFGGTGERGSVWLTSLAMWWNCLAPLAAAGEPLTVGELRARARMDTNLDGMRRWGFITIDGIGRVPRGSAARPRARTRSALSLTARGRSAAERWAPLPELVEARWRERFGVEAIERLRAALIAIARADEAPLPDFMPIGRVEALAGSRTAADRDADSELGLVSLLSRVLMRFALDHREGDEVPLLAWANGLRVLSAQTPVPVRELPRLTGVWKEALAVVTGRLEKRGLLRIEQRDGDARGRQLRLTARGTRARAAGERRIAAVTASWQERFSTTSELTAALQTLAGDGTREGSPLWAGLRPPAGGWRSQAPPPELLPWYPLLTHRGGYPDGA